MIATLTDVIFIWKFVLWIGVLTIYYTIIWFFVTVGFELIIDE